jgi:hypothetical protein
MSFSALSFSALLLDFVGQRRTAALTLQSANVAACCADMPPCFAAFFAEPPQLPSVADVMACLRSEKVRQTSFSAPELAALLRAPRNPSLFCAMIPWLHERGLDAVFGRDWLTAALGLRDFAALRAVFDAGLVTIDAFTQEITAELLLRGGEFALAAPRCGVAFAPTAAAPGQEYVFDMLRQMRKAFLDEREPRARLELADNIWLSIEDIASILAKDSRSSRDFWPDGPDPRSSRDFWPDGIDARARYFLAALRSGDPVACMMLPDHDFSAFPWRDVLQAAVDGGLLSLLWLRRRLLECRSEGWEGAFSTGKDRPLEARLFDLLPELALEAVRASVFDAPDRADRDRDIVMWCLSRTSSGCKRLTRRCGYELGVHCEVCYQVFTDRVCRRFLEVVDRHPSRMPEYIKLFLAVVPPSVLTGLVDRGVFILAALCLRNSDLLAIVAPSPLAPFPPEPVFRLPKGEYNRIDLLIAAAGYDIRLLPHLFERMPDRVNLVKYIAEPERGSSVTVHSRLVERFLRWYSVWEVHACCCS